MAPSTVIASSPIAPAWKDFWALATRVSCACPIVSGELANLPSELLARRWHCLNTNKGENAMPVLLWALGVPLTIVLALMLFGVVHF